MLKNLKKALDNKGISLRAFAVILNVSEKTVWNKINEETPFTYPEVAKTMKEIFPEYSITYLFASEKAEEKE